MFIFVCGVLDDDDEEEEEEEEDEDEDGRNSPMLTRARSAHQCSRSNATKPLRCGSSEFSSTT